MIVHHGGVVEAGRSNERGASRGSGEQRERPRIHRDACVVTGEGVTAVRSCHQCAGGCSLGRRHRAFILAPTSFISFRITNNPSESSTLFVCFVKLFGSSFHFKSRSRCCDVGGCTVQYRGSNSSSTDCDWSLCGELTHTRCTVR